MGSRREACQDIEQDDDVLNSSLGENESQHENPLKEAIGELSKFVQEKYPSSDDFFDARKSDRWFHSCCFPVSFVTESTTIEFLLALLALMNLGRPIAKLVSAKSTLSVDRWRRVPSSFSDTVEVVSDRLTWTCLSSTSCTVARSLVPTFVSA